ncbi:hypothetical protein L914_16860 [Phytophthora nicotianae]|uniref:Uncharacterized protein n=1 Tax=Phytophthora nicotianae TaxID=4792 RepID=W2MJC1_PHYNI|nr:hypothetical protein L914_16860 [Phytophthora nicotianae]
MFKLGVWRRHSWNVVTSTVGLRLTQTLTDCEAMRMSPPIWWSCMSSIARASLRWLHSWSRSSTTLRAVQQSYAKEFCGSDTFAVWERRTCCLSATAQCSLSRDASTYSLQTLHVARSNHRADLHARYYSCHRNDCAADCCMYCTDR